MDVWRKGGNPTGECTPDCRPAEVSTQGDRTCQGLRFPAMQHPGRPILGGGKPSGLGGKWPSPLLTIR